MHHVGILNRMSGTILLTGFDKFGPYDRNPAAEIAEALDGQTIGGYSIRGIRLPINFRTFREELHDHLTEINPSIALGLGMDFKDVPHLSVEMEARPIARYGTFQDEEGSSAGTVTLDSNPAVLIIPNREQLEHAIQAMSPYFIASTNAGGHMCETVLRDLITLSEGGKQFLPGFVHVPHLEEQLEQSAALDPHVHSMPFDEQLRRVQQYLEVVIAMCEASE